MASHQKRALVTGVTGQDGSYLAELLVGKGYHVVGMSRADDIAGRQAIAALVPDVEMVDGDLAEFDVVEKVVAFAKPDEIYHLGGISFVGEALERPELTGDVTGLGAARMLEAARRADAGAGRVRFFQASSAEIFGRPATSPQDESTPIAPVNPYGAAKAYAHHMVQWYRESHGLFACSGILFNHESPRRPPQFVTRKITSGVARISLGLQDTISLGNLDAARDWGFAGDYVRAMWLMLQHDRPGDYVVATGKPRTVRDFLAAAFGHVGIADWADRVVIDPRFVRPNEAVLSVGDPARAEQVLGWRRDVAFETLVAMMVDEDLARERHTQAFA